MQALGLPPLDEEKEKASDRTFGERPATDGTGAPAQSPPKPPVPEILGEPKQYGMMKVHHPQSIKRLSSLKEPSVDQASESAASSRQVSPPSADAKPESKNNTESSALNGMQSAPQLVAPKVALMKDLEDPLNLRHKSERSSHGRMSHLAQIPTQAGVEAA
jgi:hypothetical protein